MHTIMAIIGDAAILINLLMAIWYRYKGDYREANFWLLTAILFSI